jgi:hypothetical protein
LEAPLRFAPILLALGLASAPAAGLVSAAGAPAPGATVVSVDDRFGVPRFVWAARDAAARQSATPAQDLDAATAARAELARIAPLYRLDGGDVAGARLRHLHDTGRGGIIATYEQAIDGVPVFGEELKLLLDRGHALIAASGFLASASLAADAGADGRKFDLSEEEAGARGLAAFAAREGAAAASALTDPLRVERVYFHRPGTLEPAYYVEVIAERAARSYVISAKDGGVRFENDLVAHAFSYRVWADATAPYMPLDGPQGSGPTPHPTGTPLPWDPGFVAPSLVTLDFGPIATGDPWLAPGATQTSGNNVDAYADLVSPDGWSSGVDLRATLTGPGAFDRTYDPALPPTASPNQTMAAVTQLFYTTNWLHDWFYDAGFDEASGNAQLSNYGRGGIPGDVIRAEVQDYSGTNNATMITTADGFRPRMQMFVFNPNPTGSLVVANPAAIAGWKPFGRCSFAPATFAVTGDAVFADDGVAPASDACGPLVNAVAGKIVLVDRGACSYATQVVQAQNAGAIGVVVVNDADGAPPARTGTPSVPVTIAVFSMARSDGDAIRALLAAGTPVTITMTSTAQLVRDGTIDNQTITHEWGHYMSNRLVGNGSGLNTNQARGLGEGWSDFTALLLTVRPEDADAPANAGYSGTFSFGGYPLSPSLAPSTAYYFGLRRYPYSTDFAKNPLTYRHVTLGVPLPVGPPVAFGANGGYNPEIHSAGEVWCTMLWECYAALLRDNHRLKFVEAQRRMRDYLVASYKLTPLSPTLVEARDALFAVAYASDPKDHAAFCEAFARRGAGIGAVAPARDSEDNAGVVESFACGGALAFVSAALDDADASCDGDGMLDRGETGRLRVTLANLGSVPLTGTTATVSCADPYVAFPEGNIVALSVSEPFGTATGTIPVRLTGAPDARTLAFTVEPSDPGLVVAAAAGAFEAVANGDVVPSARETFELPSDAWLFAGNPFVAANAWQRVAIGDEHRGAAPDPPVISDQSLVTPPMAVAAQGPLTIAFRHRHAFETVAGSFKDGGVVELSVDGANWVDAGALAGGVYGGTIAFGGGNPLAGRPAFVGRNAAYPALEPVTLDLGGAYAGHSVRVRFRLVTDVSGGDAGWEVDDVAIGGLAAAPFAELVPEPDACGTVAADPALPAELAFAVAGSNPARSAPALRFDLPRPAQVRIDVFDVAGRRVATLADGTYPAGSHIATWRSADGRGPAAAAGVYFARLVADGRDLVTRVVLLRAP